MADDDKSRGRTRRLVTGAVGRIGNVSGAITGRSLEQELAEFGDTFTTVVLGLKEDVDSFDRRLNRIEEALEKAGNVRPPESEHPTVPRLLWAISVTGLFAGIIALGIAVWTAL